jgi:hypothetical protein
MELKEAKNTLEANGYERRLVNTKNFSKKH